MLATTTDPEVTIYEDIKRLYNLRSLIVHGSNPTTEQLENHAFEISAAARSSAAGERWALVLDRCRDLLRRAILAHGFLTAAGKWPTRGRAAEDFDVDALLIDPTTREEMRQTWRGAVESLGLGSAAHEAPLPSLHVELPDPSYRPGGDSAI